MLGDYGNSVIRISGNSGVDTIPDVLSSVLARNCKPSGAKVP